MLGLSVVGHPGAGVARRVASPADGFSQSYAGRGCSSLDGKTASTVCHMATSGHAGSLRASGFVWMGNGGWASAAWDERNSCP